MHKTTALRLRGIELAIFSGLEALSLKLDETIAPKLESADVQPMAELIGKLFFQYDANGYMESIRLQRAKALLAFSKVSCSELVRKAISMEILDEEIGKEPAAAVKDLLQQVRRE